MLINPISPNAFNIAGLSVRWYAIAYIAAFLVGFYMLKQIAKNKFGKKQFDDLFTYLIFGVIIGGRLGYVLFYNLGFFLHHPLEILAVWHGGMSFHGGLLGVIASVYLFSMKLNKQKQCGACNVECEVKSENKSTLHTSHFTLQNIKNSFAILDVLTVVAPIGLFFGRIANFINMEVMGRATSGPLGIVFAGAADQTPRHPSPLYEAGLEGIALFIIMFCLWKWTKLKERAGALSGIFAMVYAVFRIFAEQFRQPDEQIGFLTSWGLTMGQLLSAAMLIAGAAVFAYAIKGNKK